MNDSVLTCHQGTRERQQALESLWGSLDPARWPDASVPLVIQVGGSGRTPLSIDTARSLGRWLTERTPGARIEIADVLDHRESWGSMAMNRWTDTPPVPVAGLGGLRSVNVPAAWFEPFFLITIAAAHPSASTRVASVLDAQAEVLFALNPTAPRGALRAEAHRLAAADLAIACGSSGSPERAWWIACGSDVAVEAAVGAGSGLDPAQLPALRRIAEHELLPEFTSAPPTGSLGVRPASGVQAGLASIGDAWTAWRATVAHDVPSFRRNVKKIPAFARRYAVIFGLIRG